MDATFIQQVSEWKTAATPALRETKFQNLTKTLCDWSNAPDGNDDACMEKLSASVKWFCEHSDATEDEQKSLAKKVWGELLKSQAKKHHAQLSASTAAMQDDDDTSDAPEGEDEGDWTTSSSEEEEA